MSERETYPCACCGIYLDEQAPYTLISETETKHFCRVQCLAAWSLEAELDQTSFKDQKQEPKPVYAPADVGVQQAETTHYEINYAPIPTEARQTTATGRWPTAGVYHATANDTQHITAEMRRAMDRAHQQEHERRLMAEVETERRYELQARMEEIALRNMINPPIYQAQPRHNAFIEHIEEEDTPF